jgi:ketosteroid isomerase-like protein
MGVKATQKPVAIRGLSLIWTKDEGSITDLHLYFDVAAVKAQLGVGPKELVAAASQAVAAANAVAAASDAGVREPPQIFDQASPAIEQSNVAMARAALDALENGNLPAYEGNMADDLEITTLTRLQPARGKAEATAYFKTMRKAISQLDTTVSDAWGIGSFAILEYTITGEQLGTLLGVPAQQDKAIRLHLADVVEVAGGKIARIWRYDNPAELIAAPL